MVRTKSRRRLGRILDAALDAFLELGYRGTRLDEVARRAGVSVGTLYLYAKGKEALFELVLRRAFKDPLPDVDHLPFAGTAGPDLVDWVWNRFQRISSFPRLEAAAAAPAPADPMAELEGIVRELWDWLSSHWQAIELIERCARDWPELHLLYYKQFRRGAFATATVCLARRMDEGVWRRYPDPATAMRVIVENVAFFAMHRHVRPDSASLDEDTCRETVIPLLLAGFDPRCGEAGRRDPTP